MSYEYRDPRSSFGLPLVLGLVGLAAAVVAFFLLRGCDSPPEPPLATADPSVTEPVDPVDPVVPPVDPVLPADVPGAAPGDQVPETPEEILATLGVGVKKLNPAELVEQIGKTLEAGKVPEAAEMIGRKALSPDQLARLREMAGEARIRLKEERPVSEIGELEIRRRGRWALNLDDEIGSRIYFDLERDLQGRWAVDKVVLPPLVKPGEKPSKAVLVDALGIADAFLQAALAQNFETAKSFVDSKQVSDAKIAGLCIVFEEGQYQMREQRPLRAMFNRETTAGFLANVEVLGVESAAQFGLNVARDDAASPWRISEINLDALLADYADRVAGGDVYFTPLVKNPEGGDTLILYFGFDENTLAPRTRRQLEIVSLLLQTDGGRKLTLSGHTDAVGSKSYNQGLSKDRAEAVKRFLVESGVNPAQIETLAMGQSRPRRPNTTEDGEDDPSGRRANRRTEIYLNF